MDLLAFERKLDQTITRKRLDIQEALKRPVKMKRKLRVFISNQFYPPKNESADAKDDAGKVIMLDFCSLPSGDWRGFGFEKNKNSKAGQYA